MIIRHDSLSFALCTDSLKLFPVNSDIPPSISRIRGHIPDFRLLSRRWLTLPIHFRGLYDCRNVQFYLTFLLVIVLFLWLPSGLTRSFSLLSMIILSILQHYSTRKSMCLRSTRCIVHVSAPYRKIKNINVITTLIFTFFFLIYCLVTSYFY